jgi:hypothetical protein
MSLKTNVSLKPMLLRTDIFPAEILKFSCNSQAVKSTF